MSITHLHVLAVALLAAAPLGACTARADARLAPEMQARATLVAPVPASDARLVPQAPFDERPITPFETVGASCVRTQC